MNDELYHYGIKGMKWGIRRYQNPDGSLTEAGKKRYLDNGSFTKKGRRELFNRNGDPNESGLAYLNSTGHNVTYKTVTKYTPNEQTFSRLTPTGKSIEQASQRLVQKSKKLFDESFKATDAAEDAIDEISKSKKIRSEALSMMKKNLGGSPANVDDDELIDLAAYDVADILVEKYAHNTISGKKADEFDRKMAGMIDSAKGETDRLIDQVGDIPISYTRNSTKTSRTYRDAVYEILLKSVDRPLVEYNDSAWEYAHAQGYSFDDFVDAIADDFRKS